jgi:glycosyltransferase involved in cell wall biosynthesis
MSQLPSIDVVIRTFNRPRKLMRALDSLRQQQSPISAVYIVDNGTNPATREVAENASVMASHKHSVHYLRSREGSARTAAGVGIEASTAEWIILLCDDDFLVPSRIQEDRKIIQSISRSTVLIQHSFLRADYGYRRIWLHRVPEAPIPLSSALLFRGMGPPGSCTFKGETARNHHPFFEEIGVGDYDLYASLLAHGEGIGASSVGFVMDDTRVEGRETTMGTQLVEMVLEHERRYSHLSAKAHLSPQSLRRGLRKEATFFLGKAMGLKAFSSKYRDLAITGIPALLAGTMAFVRQRYLSWMPLESRGSVTYSFKAFGKINPDLALLVETNELPR